MLSSGFSGGQRSRQDGLSLEDAPRLSPEQEALLSSCSLIEKGISCCISTPHYRATGGF